MPGKGRKKTGKGQLERLLEQLDSTIKLELASFFADNPDTIDSADSLAIWIGAEPEQVEREAAELVEAGLLQRHGEGASIVFTLTSDEKQRRLIQEVAGAYRAAKNTLDKQRIALQEERTRIARRARLLEVRLDAVLSTLPEGIVVTSPRGEIILGNEAACRMLDIKCPGKGERISPESVPHAELRALFTRREPVQDEVLQVGERFLRVASRDIVPREGAAEGRVYVLADITDLERLSRMKSEAVSFVSHELKSPLTTLKFVASSILEQRLEQERREQFLQLIVDEVDRLTRMINGFLDLAQLEAGKPLQLTLTTFDLNALLRELCERQRFYANDHQLVFECTKGKEPVKIEADKGRVEQIVINLITNAVKYSPAHSTVSVKLEPSKTKVKLYVKDEGFGITPDDLEKIFEPYYRTESARRKKGTGLGLPLVKQLVEAHKGTVSVESEPGKGSTFLVELPLSQSN